MVLKEKMLLGTAIPVFGLGLLRVGKQKRCTGYCSFWGELLISSWSDKTRLNNYIAYVFPNRINKNGWNSLKCWDGVKDDHQHIVIAALQFAEAFARKSSCSKRWSALCVVIVQCSELLGALQGRVCTFGTLQGAEFNNKETQIMSRSSSNHVVLSPEE